MFGAAQMTMRRERPVEPRWARGCRGVTPVSGLPGSPASRCPARDKASRRRSNRPPGSDRRRCHRRIEQHLPTGAIAQEAYRKYTLTSSNRTTTAVELVGTSNKPACTRESEMPGACLAFFHTAGAGGETDSTMRKARDRNLVQLGCRIFYCGRTPWAA